MNNQEIFDRVYKHMLTQGRRSLLNHTNGTCAYRSNDGLKCAVGCLIDDENYHYGLERYAAHSVVVRLALAKSGVDNIHEGNTLELLMALQNVHDMADPIAWESRLKALATAFGLTVPELGNEQHS